MLSPPIQSQDRRPAGTNCRLPVSNEDMSLKPRLWKVLRRAGVVSLLLVFVAMAFIQSEQWLLRRRAQCLLNDIRQIQMGKSSWADAQRLMTKWGAWGGYYGSCTAERCDYHIAMQDWFRGMPATTFEGEEQRTVLDYRHCCGWLKPAYRLLGGRFAVVQGWIQVRNGVIWTKDYSVRIADSYEDYLPWKNTGGYLDPIIAYAGGSTHLVRIDFSPDHPEYSIDLGPCTVCTLVEISFTPRTDKETLKKLLDVDLSCLTRWIGCKQDEIMPEAYKLAAADSEKAGLIARDSSECRAPIDLAARDARYIAIAEVADIKEDRNSDEVVRLARFRSLASLKNNAYVGPLLFREELPLRPESKLVGGVPTSTLKLGDRVILLFDAIPDENELVFQMYDLCNYIPITTENLAAVRNGVALDVVPREH